MDVFNTQTDIHIFKNLFSLNSVFAYCFLIFRKQVLKNLYLPVLKLL